MLKNLFSFIKKIIVSVLIIYGYNKLVIPDFLFIPMNYFTISLVTLFGIPSIIMIVLFSLICL